MHSASLSSGTCRSLIFMSYCPTSLSSTSRIANLRDTLLPRLTSGQLRLPEALATVAEEAVA